MLNLFEMFYDRAREDIKEAFRNPRECKSLLYVLQTPTPPHTHTSEGSRKAYSQTIEAIGLLLESVVVNEPGRSRRMKRFVVIFRFQEYFVHLSVAYKSAF